MNSHTFFTVFPPELRLMIYGFVFESSEEQRFPHPLLQTSQQLREECKPILLPHLGLQITKGYYYDTNSPWILALVPRLNIKYCHERNYTWHAFCNNPYLLDLLPYITKLGVFLRTPGTSCSPIASVESEVARDSQYWSYEKINTWYTTNDPADGPQDWKRVGMDRQQFQEVLGAEKVCSKEMIATCMFLMEEAHQE